VNTGACLEALRRTRSGDFRLTEALTLEALRNGIGEGDLIPMHELLPGFRAIVVTDEGLTRVSHGRHLEPGHYTVEEVESTGQEGLAPGLGQKHAKWVRVFDATGRLVALGTAGPSGDSLHPAIVLT
jgi:tRNA U55 pseudouridine synthase TruB